MAVSRLAGWHKGRTAIMVLGGLLLSALIVSTTPSGAQTKTDPKTKDSKGKVDPKAAPTPPPPLKLTIASKDKDVAANVKMINDRLGAQWKANNIVHSRWADDYEFIRRASLDIIGRIATVPEVNAYLKDPPDTRRSLLIDRLLDHPDYAKHWADMWSNWLLTRSGIFGRGIYHEEMKKWLEDRFAVNNRHPFDSIVRELVTASGKNTENGGRQLYPGPRRR